MDTQYKKEGVPIGTRITQAQAAKMMNVSLRSVARASKVRRECIQEVVKAIEAGFMSVSLAVKLIDEPEDFQRQIAEAGEDAKKVYRALKGLPRKLTENEKCIQAFRKAEDQVEALRQILDEAPPSVVQAALSLSGELTRA